MLKKYGDNVNNIHIVNEGDFVCGYDGITFNYKMADNVKQVRKHYSTTYYQEINISIQVQEIMKKLCEFSTVWADWADLGSTETAKQKLKYATTFEGGSSAFQV